jgi:hypothetical protein
MFIVDLVPRDVEAEASEPGCVPYSVDDPANIAGDGPAGACRVGARGRGDTPRRRSASSAGSRDVPWCRRSPRCMVITTRCVRARTRQAPPRQRNPPDQVPEQLARGLTQSFCTARRRRSTAGEAERAELLALFQRLSPARRTVARVDLQGDTQGRYACWPSPRARASRSARATERGQRPDGIPMKSLSGRQTHAASASGGPERLLGARRHATSTGTAASPRARGDRASVGALPGMAAGRTSGTRRNSPPTPR